MNTQNKQINEIVGVLIGKDTKLRDLNQDNMPMTGWAVAWSHYALVGDALEASASRLDADGFANINGVRIGPENTVQELLTALGN
jgi:hypothetical protein